MRQNYILFAILLLSLLTFVGCESVDLSNISDEDLERISEKAVICNEPYIRKGIDCCLDRDGNQICDADERGVGTSDDVVIEKETPKRDEIKPTEEYNLPIVQEDLEDDDAVKGDLNAPITIVEFGDYECPFCARFYSQTFEQIDKQYIKTGKVRYVFRDFPLSFHRQAQKAAEAAECAGEQGRYYEMHDLLFEQGVQGGEAAFIGYAEEMGLDKSDFKDCLYSGEMAEEVLNDFAEGQRLGVQGTPNFFVNGIMISGAQPFTVFEQIIEKELEN